MTEYNKFQRPDRITAAWRIISSENRKDFMLMLVAY